MRRIGWLRLTQIGSLLLLLGQGGCVIAAVPYLVAGATGYHYDASGNAKSWGGYAQGQAYELKCDAFLVRDPDFPKYLFLSPACVSPRNGIRLHNNTPDSLEAEISHMDPPATAAGGFDQFSNCSLPPVRCVQ